MKLKLSFMLITVLMLGFGSFALAQVDSAGDLNADITDPWPNDPIQGGVYFGGTITYNVLMRGIWMRRDLRERLLPLLLME